MTAAGPDAPTLCEGWQTRDLAAHLVVRERRLDATPGIVLPFLAGYTEKVQDRLVHSKSWAVLLGLISSGPPIYSPFKLLDPIANLGEMFIHHEDVRRAAPQWEPRVLDDSTARLVRRQLGLMSRLLLKRSPAQVVLGTPDGENIARAGRGATVTVTGDPQELLLFVVGRDAVRVDFDGDPQAVAALQAAPRGL